jgi:hypothetical protein
MFLPHLHALGTDAPLTGLKVYFGPLGATKLAGANEYVGGQTQGGTRNRVPVVAIKGAQQLANLCRLSDGGAMLRLERRQRVLKVARGVAVGTARGDCVPQYLRKALLGPVCRLDSTPRLNLAQHRQ